MGRIVIPRVRQEARQQLQRKRRTGYFANGFGPQEMQLVSKLADLAVAGGGQIARAVQISNLEKEQAAAQAEYDQRLQSEIESRQRAAQAEIADVQLGGGPEAFMSDFFFNRPDVALKPPDSPDTSALRGVTQQRGAPIIASGSFAPEDARRLAMRTAVGRPPVKPTGDGSPHVNPFDPRAMYLSTAPSDLMEPVGAPSTPLTRDDILREASAAGIDPRSDLVREALSRVTAPEVVSAAPLDELSLLAASPRLEAITQARAQALQQAQQEMQGRDFRQEAMEAVGPAPERKLFRIADILAAAPSARTAEQRAMLLQAASDSPDIQATGLTDLARGAYRDRAMQAVLKLFPKEDKGMSELDKARYDQITARTDLIDLQRQQLEQKMGDVSRAKSLGGTVRTSRGPDTGDAFDSATAWTEYYEDKEAKRGQFSDDAIFAELTALAEQRAAQEGRQPTPQDMSFNAADIDRGRREKFKRLVGRYSDATPDTILGLVAKDMPGRRQKSLRKNTLNMVGKVGDRKKALESAQIKRDNAEAQAVLIEGRQSRVLSQRQEGQQRLEGLRQQGKESLEGLRQKNRLERDRLRFKDKQQLVGTRHNLRLDEIKTRADLSADQARDVENQRARNRMLLERMRASLRGNTFSAQERIVRSQIARNEAMLQTNPDPITRAYLNSYIAGLKDILGDVKGGRIPALSPPAPTQSLTPEDRRDLEQIRQKHGRKSK